MRKYFSFLLSPLLFLTAGCPFTNLPDQRPANSTSSEELFCTIDGHIGIYHESTNEEGTKQLCLDSSFCYQPRNDNPECIECFRDTSCNLGDICNDNKCIPKPEEETFPEDAHECLSDSQCPPDFLCNDSFSCESLPETPIIETPLEPESSCTPESYTSCVGNDIASFNSCEEFEQITQTCEHGCESSQCLEQTISQIPSGFYYGECLSTLFTATIHPLPPETTTDNKGVITIGIDGDGTPLSYDSSLETFVRVLPGTTIDRGIFYSLTTSTTYSRSNPGKLTINSDLFDPEAGNLVGSGTEVYTYDSEGFLNSRQTTSTTYFAINIDTLTTGRAYGPSIESTPYPKEEELDCD